MITTEIQKSDFNLEFKVFFNQPPTISTQLKEILKKECGYFILINDLLKAKRKEMAMHLLNHEPIISVQVQNEQKLTHFIEQILMEAKESTTRHALELSTTLAEALADDQFLKKFLTCFKRFSKYVLEMKLHQM